MKSSSSSAGGKLYAFVAVAPVVLVVIAPIAVAATSVCVADHRHLPS
jgi:uncharacterized protein involved in cysteine biosynthesis